MESKIPPLNSNSRVEKYLCEDPFFLQSRQQKKKLDNSLRRCGSFSWSRINGDTLERIDLKGIEFAQGLVLNKTLSDVNLANSEIAFSRFSKTDFRGVNFDNANLKATIFDKGRFEKVSFKKTDLRGSRFTFSFFKDVQLEEARFGGTRFEFCSFPEKLKSFIEKNPNLVCVGCQFYDKL